MEHGPQIEQILNSADNMGRASMPEALKTRVIAAMASNRTRIIGLHRPIVMLLAAGLALLICFNVYTLASSQQHRPKQNAVLSPAPNPIADEYFSPAPSI
jgi:putative ribosome biogenesis GTPase RsgA